MILLVTPIERRDECAALLKQVTGERVVVAQSLAQATIRLRTDDYTAAVFDQHLAESEPHETDTALQHLGAAIPVQINLAISAPERLVREVRAAVRRRQYEEAAAREAASRALHSDLNDTVTMLLLNSELALETPGLPATATEHLAALHETAQKLRAKLDSGATVN